MPEQPQTTVDILETPGALGDVSGFSTSDTESLKVAFPGSPIYADYDPKEFFEKNVMSGERKIGFGFSSFKPDFSGAPDFGSVETGDGGKPASAFVPNPVSPGAGSQNASDIGAPPAGFGTAPNADVYGSGQGSTTNPKDTSASISKVKLNDYKIASGPGQRLYEGE